MILLELFIEFFKVGAFSFGGGLATLPNIYKLAEATNWCSAEDVSTMLTLSQITPGPLATNVATLIGIKLNGVSGGTVAALAFCIIPFLVLAIISLFIESFLQNPIIASMFKAVSVAVCVNFIKTISSLAKSAIIDKFTLVIFVIVFILSVFTDISNMVYMAMCVVVGVIVRIFKYYKDKEFNHNHP